MKNREQKFLNALKKGTTLSRKQAISCFSLANPSAAVLRFQQAGINIQRQYTYSKKTRATTVRYTIGN